MIRLLLLFVILSSYPASAGAEDTSTSAPFSQELRISWGGGRPRSVAGQIAISDGTLKIVRYLSMHDDALGDIRVHDGKSLEFSQNDGGTYGGCDVSVNASATAQLQVQFHDSLTGKTTNQLVSLNDLQKKGWVHQLDESGNRIAIERAIHDRLRVESKQHSNHIVPCDADWIAYVSGDHIALDEGDYQLIAWWAGGKSNLVNHTVRVSSDGCFAPTELKIRMPSVEGACRLEVALVRSSLLSSIAPPKPLVSRSVDLLAFRQQAPQSVIGGWQPILAIDTMAAIHPNGFAWLNSIPVSLATRAMELPGNIPMVGLTLSEQMNRLLPFSKAVTNYGAVRSAGMVSVREVADSSNDSRCVTLSPTAWIALPLAGLQAGKPHRLRIELPIDQPNSLSFSVQDTSGEPRSILEPQSSVEIKEAECVTGQLITHEMLFWPQGDSINLLLSNSSKTREASVGKILVEQAKLREWTDSWGQTTGKRRVAIYLDQPWLVEATAAPRERDPLTGRYYETWKTWQAVAERLVMQMQLSGSDTLVLSAVTGGKSLIPLTSIAHQHQLNQCTYFSDGRSPKMHDILELLLLHFDRAKLNLIVEVDFPSAQQFQESVNLSDIALTQNQLTLISQSDLPSQTFQTRLDPLHPRVQAALTEPILEIAERYNAHPAFAGISIRADADSQFMFAGDRWGYNGQNVERFAAENGLTLPREPNQRSQLLLGSSRLRYLEWRAKLMTDYWQRLSQQINRISDNCQLHLNLLRLSSSPPGPQDFVEPDLMARNTTHLLMAYGVDLASLSKIDGVQLAYGSVRHSNQILNSTEWLDFVSPKIEPKFTDSGRYSAFITHQPRAQKLATAMDQQRGPTKETWIYPDALRQGSQACRILLEQLYHTDPIFMGMGGWHPVWIGEPRVQGLLASFKSLPAVPMKRLELSAGDGPVCIRYVSDHDKHYVSLVNLSPWKLAVLLELTHLPSTHAILARPDIVTEETSQGLIVHLPAHDFVALTSSDQRLVDVRNVQYQLPDQAVQQCVVRLDQFESLLAQAADPGQQRVLFGTNGSFEQWSEVNKPVGWNVSALPQTSIQQSTELPHAGAYSLMMENQNASPATAWIQSAPIDIPDNGRLTLRAWIRVPASAPIYPLVRLGVIGRLKSGERYHRSIVLGGALKDSSRRLTDDWGRRPAELPVADLPIDDLTELQVAIDLIGPGKIWLDDVEVVQNWLQPEERNFLRGQLLVCKQKLSNGNPFIAERLLSSAWGEYLLEMNPFVEPPNYRVPPASSGEDESRTSSSRPKSTLQQWRESMRQRWNR